MSALLLPAGISLQRLGNALSVCEQVAGKDRSNLYVVSQFFEDRVRYDAFIAMYAVMRLVDDLVDDVVDKTALTTASKTALLNQLDDWELRIREAYAGTPRPDAIDIALAAAVRTFPVPIELWLAFVEAMRFDVRKPRFDDFDEFLDYGEGATVAPTAIYVYLLTSQRQRGGRYLAEGFDFVACGRDLGRFAYVAHVLRDVKEDLAVGRTGLVYLSDADLQAHGLSERDLRTLADGDAGDGTRALWRGLVRDLCGRARCMHARGSELARSKWDSLPVDCAFMFRVIVGMYAELLERIDADPDRVWRSESVLTDGDKYAVLQSAAEASGFRPIVSLRHSSELPDRASAHA